MCLVSDDPNGDINAPVLPMAGIGQCRCIEGTNGGWGGSRCIENTSGGGSGWVVLFAVVLSSTSSSSSSISSRSGSNLF